MILPIVALAPGVRRYECGCRVATLVAEGETVEHSGNCSWQCFARREPDRARAAAEDLLVMMRERFQ